MPSPRALFGNPAVWDSAFEAHERVIRRIEELRALAADLVAATTPRKEELVQVQNSLTQICSQNMFDVLLLVGNKRGAGAMKIARGMFEISVISSYLHQNPAKIHDYVNFAFIEGWNHLQIVEKYHPGSVPPEL